MIIVSHSKIKSQMLTTKFAFERLGFCGLTCDIYTVLFLLAFNHILLNLDIVLPQIFLQLAFPYESLTSLACHGKRKKYSFSSDRTIPSRANSRQRKMMFTLRERRERKKQLVLFFFTLYAGKEK